MTTETSRHLSADDIVIEAREPRHSLDTPVLLAWTAASETRAEIEWGIDLTTDGVAHVVCKDVYDRPAVGDVHSEAIPTTEPIPRELALALTRYSGKFAPIETIVNPVGACDADE